MPARLSAGLDKVGLRPGMACLDIGCGDGDVTRELARRIVDAPRDRTAEIHMRSVDLVDPASALGVFIDKSWLAAARQPTPATWVSGQR
jgi:trans-aconitate methyltransferase